MALIVPEGKLTVYHPAADGIATVQGLSRDWRVSDRWEFSGAQYIEPLRALSVAGDTRATSMSGLWYYHASYNQAMRDVTFPGNPPVLGFEFYDGTAYAAGTAITTYAGLVTTDLTGSYWYPNLSIFLRRYAPPDAQGIVPQTAITLWASVRVTSIGGTLYLDRNGAWTDAQVVLGLPFQSETQKNPVLAWMARAAGYLPTTNIFSEGHDAQTMKGGYDEVSYTLEYIEDSAKFDGGHILIRNSSAPDKWWHTYNENIRLIQGPVQVAVAGCRQQGVVCPILYSNGTPDNDATAWPREAQQLPSGEWQQTAQWNGILTEATGSTWTNTVTQKDDATVTLGIGYRPLVTFAPTTASAKTRPVLWLAIQDHDATIEVPSGLPAASDTAADGNLEAIRARVDNKWRGATASARFKRSATALYTSWLERGKVVISLGYQTQGSPESGLSAADLLTLWIKPGGIKRDRAGREEAGLAGLAVEMGDFMDAKLGDSDLVDMGQAGGMTATSWFTLCGNRMGLPASMIEVAAGIAAQVLPLSKPIPSTPNLAPQDGESWVQHLDEVCNAAGLRWGWNPYTAKLFLDAGRPAYVPGGSTISYTLSFPGAAEKDKVLDITHTRDSGETRNRYKVNYGDEAYRRAAYFEASAAEIQADGGDLWAVADDKDGQTVATMFTKLNERHRRRFSVIELQTRLRKDLRPDYFVRVDTADSVTQLGLAPADVYQIESIEYVCDGAEPAGSSTIILERVYIAAEALVTGGVGADSMGAQGVGA